MRPFRIVPAAVVPLLLLLLGALPGAGAWAPHVAPAAAAAPSSLKEVEPSISPGFTVEELASVNATAVSVVEQNNGSPSLELSDAATNSSRSLGPVPGGIGEDLYGSVGAGGAVLADFVNASTGTVLFDRVTPAGGLTHPSPPFGKGIGAGFPYGNRTRFFASAEGLLDEYNARSFALVANYSAKLPARASVQTLLPEGPVLYLAGTIANATGRSSLYFASLNTSSGALRQFSSNRYRPAGVSAEFFAIGEANGEIWVGGGATLVRTSPSFELATIAGLLYRFDPATRAFANVSGMLPDPRAAVWGIVAWSPSLLLSCGAYALTSSSSNELGLLSALDAKGTGLTNRSSLLPTGFVPDFEYVTSESDGWVFLGGMNLGPGTAELLAVHR